jgi:hypothetical protein
MRHGEEAGRFPPQNREAGRRSAQGSRRLQNHRIRFAVACPLGSGPQRGETRDFLGFLVSYGVPEIPIQLKPEPEFRRHSDNPRKPKSRVRSQCSPSSDELVQPRKGNAESEGQCRLRNAEWFDKLLKEHLTGMRWWPLKR